MGSIRFCPDGESIPRRPTCFIVCAGTVEPDKVEIRDGDMVIAADSGLKNAAEFGLKPDLCVGDFDSLGGIPDLPDVVYSPPQKDDTDTFMAIKEGLRRGYERFVLLASLGGARPEHSLANIELLYYLASVGKEGVIRQGTVRMTALSAGEHVFDKGCRGYVSFFAGAGDTRDVKLDGFRYPLIKGLVSALDPFPQLVSNEFTGAEARVSIGEGYLLVVMHAGLPKTG